MTPTDLVKMLSECECAMSVQKGRLWLESGDSVDLEEVLAENKENQLIERLETMLDALNSITLLGEACPAAALIARNAVIKATGAF